MFSQLDNFKLNISDEELEKILTDESDLFPPSPKTIIPERNSFTDLPDTSLFPPEFKDTFASLASKGHLAIHSTIELDFFHHKLNLPAINGNLRDDGGPERKDHFELTLNISATTVPKHKFMKARNIYRFPYFILLNLEKSTIKGFNFSDGEAQYKPNKKNRSSYRLLSNYFDISAEEKIFWESASQAQRLARLDAFNDSSIQHNSLMNEVILKINNESMLALGIKVEVYNETPQIILILLHKQLILQRATGISFPIMIYNATHNTVLLNLIDQNITPNSFVTIHPFEFLKKIQKKYPEKIPNLGFKITEDHQKILYKADSKEEFIFFKDCCEFLGYPIDQTTQQPKIISADQLKMDENIKRRKYAEQINTKLEELAQLLPAYEKKSIIQVHKRHKKDACDFEQYEEVNQLALGKFIRIHLLKITNETKSDIEELSLQQKLQKEHKQFDHYKKAYNLQFRLTIYKKYLPKNCLINYSALEEDLSWLKELSKRIRQYQENPRTEQVFVLQSNGPDTKYQQQSAVPAPFTTILTPNLYKRNPLFSQFLKKEISTKNQKLRENKTTQTSDKKINLKEIRKTNLILKLLDQFANQVKIKDTYEAKKRELGKNAYSEKGIQQLFESLEDTTHHHQKTGLLKLFTLSYNSIRQPKSYHDLQELRKTLKEQYQFDPASYKNRHLKKK